MAYYILRECKKTGREDRLRPDFDDIEDARINCEILKAGDRHSIYWVKFESEAMSAMKVLVMQSLGTKPDNIIMGHA